MKENLNINGNFCNNNSQYRAKHKNLFEIISEKYETVP